MTLGDLINLLKIYKFTLFSENFSHREFFQLLPPSLFIVDKHLKTYTIFLPLSRNVILMILYSLHQHQ